MIAFGKIAVFFFILATEAVMASVVSAQTQCFVANDDDYLISSISLSQSELTQRWIAFEDEKCENPYLEITRNYRIKNSKDKNFDLETTEVTYTARTAEAATSLKQVRYCGSTLWKKDLPISVVGRDCDGYQQPKINQMFFQILDKSETRILVGELTKEHDGTTAIKRPKNFDNLIFIIPSSSDQ